MTNTGPQTNPNSAFQIGAVEVHPDSLLVMVNGEQRRVEPKVMELLIYGSRNSGQLLSKDTILRDVWHGAHVVPEALQRVVSLLRKSLDDSPDNPIYVETISRKGYRFLLSPKPLRGDEPIQLTEKNIRTSPLILIAAALILVIISWIALTIFGADAPIAPQVDPGPEHETTELAPAPDVDDQDLNGNR